MAMMVCDRRESRLNPNAPVFVPNAAYGEVEDFSTEWWDLVKTSPRFRDYWLSQHQEDDFASSLDGGEEDCDFEFEELLVAETQCVESEEKTKSSPSKGRASQPASGIGMDAKALLKVLNVSKSPKGRGAKSPVGHSKYCEKKPAKLLSPKCTALRRINQPR